MTSEIRSRSLHAASDYLRTYGLQITPTTELLDYVSQAIGTRVESGWPNVKSFFDAALLHLAATDAPERADDDTLISTWHHLSNNIDRLKSEEDRAHLLNEIIISAAEHNFLVVTDSITWRNYTAMSVAYAPHSSGTALAAALLADEHLFIDRMSNFYKSLMTVLGFRLRSHFNGDVGPLVIATAAVVEGCGIVREQARSVLTKRYVRAGETWSPVALAISAIVSAFVEPDPQFDLSESIAKVTAGSEV